MKLSFLLLSGVCKPKPRLELLVTMEGIGGRGDFFLRGSRSGEETRQMAGWTSEEDFNNLL